MVGYGRVFAMRSIMPSSSFVLSGSRDGLLTRGDGIGVAGFPEGHHLTPNRLKELDYLSCKEPTGVDYICTQLFSATPTFTISVNAAS